MGAGGSARKESICDALGNPSFSFFLSNCMLHSELGNIYVHIYHILLYFFSFLLLRKSIKLIKIRGYLWSNETPVFWFTTIREKKFRAFGCILSLTASYKFLQLRAWLASPWHPISARRADVYPRIAETWRTYGKKIGATRDPGRTCRFLSGGSRDYIRETNLPEH